MSYLCIIVVYLCNEVSLPYIDVSSLYSGVTYPYLILYICIRQSLWLYRNVLSLYNKVFIHIYV